MSALRLGRNSVRFAHSYTAARVSYPSAFSAIRQIAAQQPQLARFTVASIRGYADKPAGRPKQHTGRAPARKTKSSTTKSTSSSSKSKAAGSSASSKPKTPAKKKKPVKKTVALTPEQIARKKEIAQKKRTQEKIRQLKAKSLKQELPKVSRQNISAWNVFLAEGQKDLGGISISERGQATKDIAARFKSLTPSEREHYNHLANQQNVARRDAFQRTLNSFSPQQVHEANTARRALTKLGCKGYDIPIKDPRKPKLAVNPRSIFLKERHASGDFKGVRVTDAVKLISQEWNELPESAKQKYDAMYERDVQRYADEYTSIYGKAPPPSRTKSSNA